MPIDDVLLKVNCYQAEKKQYAEFWMAMLGNKKNQTPTLPKHLADKLKAGANG